MGVTSTFTSILFYFNFLETNSNLFGLFKSQLPEQSAQSCSAMILPVYLFLLSDQPSLAVFILLCYDPLIFSSPVPKMCSFVTSSCMLLECSNTAIKNSFNIFQFLYLFFYKVTTELRLLLNIQKHKNPRICTKICKVCGFYRRFGNNQIQTEPWWLSW